MSFNDQVMTSLREKIRVLEERFASPPASCTKHDHCFCQPSHYRDLAIAAGAIGTAASTMLPDIEAAEFIEWSEDFDKICESKAMPILQSLIRIALKTEIQNLTSAPVIPLMSEVGEA